MPRLLTVTDPTGWQSSVNVSAIGDMYNDNDETSPYVNVSIELWQTANTHDRRSLFLLFSADEAMELARMIHRESIISAQPPVETDSPTVHPDSYASGGITSDYAAVDQLINLDVSNFQIHLEPSNVTQPMDQALPANWTPTLTNGTFTFSEPFTLS